MRQFAVIISAVAHPIAMPLLCILIGSQLDWYILGSSSSEQLYLIYIIVALSTIVFPGVNILLLRWYGSMTSLESPPKHERTLPYLSAVFFFALGYYLLRKGNISPALLSMFLGSLLALMVMALINTQWKISVHAAGIFGLIGAIVGLFQIHDFQNLFILSLLILIGGGIMTARLILKAHTPAQVYVGSLVGFASMYFCVRYGLII